MYTYCIDQHRYNNVIAYDLQAIMLRWPSNNPVEILFIESIILEGHAEAKWRMPQFPYCCNLHLLAWSRLRRRRRRRPLGGMTLWTVGLVCWCLLNEREVMLVYCCEWQRHGVRFCVSWLACVEFLPVLQAVLAIQNMNALPVPRANQVPPS